MEDDLRWETPFDGRPPLGENHLWWKTTFSGRQPSVEDNLQWKMTLLGRRPLMEDNLQMKTTFGGRRPLPEDDLRWKTTFGGSLHAAYSALRHFCLGIMISATFFRLVKFGILFVRLHPHLLDLFMSFSLRLSK